MKWLGHAPKLEEYSYQSLFCEQMPNKNNLVMRKGSFCSEFPGFRSWCGPGVAGQHSGQEAGVKQSSEQTQVRAPRPRTWWHFWQAPPRFTPSQQRHHTAKLSRCESIISSERPWPACLWKHSHSRTQVLLRLTLLTIQVTSTFSSVWNTRNTKYPASLLCVTVSYSYKYL